MLLNYLQVLLCTIQILSSKILECLALGLTGGKKTVYYSSLPLRCPLLNSLPGTHIFVYTLVVLPGRITQQNGYF